MAIPQGADHSPRNKNGNISTMQHDGRGYQHRVVDAFGNPLTSRDPLNRETDGAGTTTYTFDKNANEIASTVPGPYSSATSYTGLLNTSVETNQRGFDTTYSYDEQGREIAVTNGVNETSSTGYDAARRTVWNENPLNQRTSFTLREAPDVFRTVQHDSGAGEQAHPRTRLPPRPHELSASPGRADCCDPGSAWSLVATHHCSVSGEDRGA